jgi:hypothetical protein
VPRHAGNTPNNSLERQFEQHLKGYGKCTKSKGNLLDNIKGKGDTPEKSSNKIEDSLGAFFEVCSLDLQLYTSTQGRNSVYKSSNPVLEITYFKDNICLNTVYKFCQ